MTKEYIAYADLPSLLPVKEEDILLIASDISTLAIDSIRNEKIFNPSELIGALKRKVPKGTILFPAFVDHYKMNDVFDLKNTMPQSGTLSVAAFRDREFQRTKDPFHSFMVWGKHSDELALLESKSTFGKNSVFAFLHHHKAKMLLIDIGLQHSFTFAHYVEELEGVRYRRFRKCKVNCIDAEGHRFMKEILFYKKRPGVMLNLVGLQRILKERGVLTEQRINKSLFSIIDLAKSVGVIRNDIRTNRGYNLQQRSLLQWIKSTVKKLVP
jgi:aminoglycoside 3-N-acetyltransferase